MSVVLMSCTLLGTFNSAPVLSSGVNVKTSIVDTDDVKKSTTKASATGFFEEAKAEKQQNTKKWGSPSLFSDDDDGEGDDDNDSFSPTPVLRYGGGRGGGTSCTNTARDESFDK